MAIYERPVRLLVRDMVTDLGLKKGEILPRARVVSWFAQKYPRIKQGTVNANLILFSTNAPSRVHHGAKPEDDLFVQVDGSNFRLYDPSSDSAPIYPGGSTPIAVTPIDIAESEPPSEFAYERDLQQFLAKNLSILEPGLRLYQDEGITGIEFPAGGRSIDILAIDGKNNLVVIELKVSKGYDRVVGQLLRYMAWIGENHAEAGQAIRGVIVAREISSDLLLACSRVPGVELYEYQLSVKLRKVER